MNTKPKTDSGSYWQLIIALLVALSLLMVPQFSIADTSDHGSDYSKYGGYDDDDDDDVKNKKDKCYRVENMLKHNHYHSHKHKGVIRNQFDANNLAELSKKLVHDYFLEKRKCKITLPVWSWTGGDALPTRSNLPTEKIKVKSLTADELAERVISLAGLLSIEVDPSNRTAVLSTDIGDIKPFREGQDVHLRKMIEVMEELVARNANGEIALSETRAIALLLGITHFKSLANFYGDKNYHFSNNFLQLYSSATHKHYNQLQESYQAFIGMLSVGNWWLNYAASPLSLAPLRDYNDINAEMMIKAFQFDKRLLKKMLKAEQDAVGKYFWARIYTDTANSSLLTKNQDVEGHERDPAMTVDIYNLPGQVMTYDWLEQSTADFVNLNVAAPLGIPGFFSYNGFPAFDIIGIAPFAQIMAPEIADNVLVKSGKIWDNKIKPIYQELLALSEIRRAESHDDDYTGSWRAKIPKVNKVNRNPDGTAASVEVVLPVHGTVVVPIGGPMSNDPVIREVQEGIAEMDKWFNDNLANAQTLHDGDNFNLLVKIDENRGACGGEITGTNRYGGIDEIIANYSTEVKTVGVDAELADLVFQSGFAISRFLYDLREFTADLYVKENFAAYGFTDEASAGVCRTPPSQAEVTYEQVRDKISAEVSNDFESSDVNRLGRHYGYDELGVKVPEEWNGDELVYKFSAPDTSNVLKKFDYVYRQHYAVDTSAALTPANVTDPETGKMFYQYTDPGDDARRSQFIDNFSSLEVLSDGAAKAGQLGTYYRWKLDFMFQKISAYVIDKAPQEGIDLLPPDFVENYYSSTFVDTNGDTCGFNFAKSNPEILRFRIIGQLGGSANSGTSLDPGENTIDINVRLVTLAPHRDREPINQLSLMLHEGSLGHGFDNVPNNVDFLRGIERDLSWLTTINSLGIVGEGDVLPIVYPSGGPGIGTLFEGWATYGEVLGSLKEFIVNFDDNGCPIDGDVNLASQFFGLVELSRLGGRQVVSVGMNYSKYAWTFFKSVNEFTQLTDIPVSAGTDFHMRFIGHPTQQTTYAAGLITNLGVLSVIREEAASQGCEVNEPEFNKFRITRTDYILGAPLTQIVQDNIDLFLDCN